MKIIFVITILFLTFKAIADENIVLVVGEQKKINTTLNDQITLSNPKAITVKKEGRKLLIIAKKPGTSFISLSKNKKIFQITVYPVTFMEAKKSASQLQAALSDLTLTYSPKKIIIQALIRRIDDWYEVVRLKKLFPNQIDIVLSGSTEILNQIKNKIMSSLNSRALSSATIETKNKTLSLVSSSRDPNVQKMVSEVAEEWGLTTVLNSAAVELRPMIEIEITIAEVKKTNLRSLGLKLPGQYSATIIPSTAFDSLDKKFNPFDIQFNAQLENQITKVIANPKLLCRSGEVAHFIAGGEIPIKIVSFKTSDVIWKKYGVILDITPQADIQQNISTKITTEISLLDEAHKVEGIPALLTNRVETHFDLKGEKTIALSGLIKNELGRGTTSNSLLGEIPILGELFKSKEFKDNKTEMIVFVTPRVITPDNPPAIKSSILKADFWKDDE